MHSTSSTSVSAALALLTALAASSLPLLLLQSQLCANSTRKARWDAHLGPLTAPAGTVPLQIPLCTVIAGGGLIAAVDVVVLRCYPVRYMAHVDSDQHTATTAATAGTTATTSTAAASANTSRTNVVLSEAEEEGCARQHALHCNSLLEAAESSIEADSEAELADDRPDVYTAMMAAGKPIDLCHVHTVRAMTPSCSIRLLLYYPVA
jgi:hypothetical protein